MVRNDRAEDLESALHSCTRGHGRLRGPAQVGVVEIDEAIHAGANLAPLTQLFPLGRGALGAHRLQDRPDGLTVPDHHTVHAADLTSLCGDAEAMCRSDERHGRLRRRAGHLERGRATRIRERAGGQERPAPDRRQVFTRSRGEFVGETANGTAALIEQARLTRQRLAAVDDTDDEMAFLTRRRRLHVPQLGTHTVELDQIPGRAAREHLGVEFSLDGDAVRDRVKTARETKQ